MYSNIALVILFLVIVVVGIFVNKRPIIPEGFETDFCARQMTGNPDCPRFYKLLFNNAFFSQLSTTDKKEKVLEYINTYTELMTDSKSFPTLSESEQNRVIQERLKDGRFTATESTRAQTRLQGVCPTEAYYDAEGKIHVEPNGMTFSNMTDYTNFLAAMYAKNDCKPIGAVRAYKGPLDRLLGGLGSGEAAPEQVAAQRNDRTVVNQALDDLFEKWQPKRDVKEGEIPVRTFQFPAPGEQTYAKTPINRLDDYEFSRVFELENRPRMAPLSKEAKSNLLGAMQLDWPVLPYSSDTRAKLEEQFVDARMQDVAREPKSGVFFRNMDGVDVEPPDEDATAAREAKILSTYQPTAITTHVVDDEYERVAKVVAQQYSTDPDWEPVVEKRGPHQYAVTELRPRRKKEDDAWEEEAPTTLAKAEQQGLLEGAEVKPTAMTIQDNLQDPYFAKTGVADHSNDRFWRYSDFNKWTPGLERMFAPTDPTNEWH